MALSVLYQFRDLVSGVSVGILPYRLVWKTRIMRLPDSKKFEDIFSRFNRIPACDGQTDGHLGTAQSALCITSGSNNRDVRPIAGFVIDDWWSVECCKQISTVKYVYSTKHRPPFIAADGHDKTQRISDSSHEWCSVVTLSSMVDMYAYDSKR